MNKQKIEIYTSPKGTGKSYYYDLYKEMLRKEKLLYLIKTRKEKYIKLFSEL